jgi:ribose transport system substrate-binding protein
VLFLSGALALFSFGMSASLVRDLLRKVPSHETQQTLDHHYSLYVPDNRTSYFSELVAGARKGAAECHAALSVHQISFVGKDLRMASWSGVDGVIVCPDLDDAIVSKNLEKLRADKIPVVLANHNIPADQPWPFVGTNNFDFGKKAGALAKSGTSGGVRLAIVYSDKSPAIYAERELVEMGISSALGDRMTTAIASLKTDANPRAAEETVYQLVRSRPDITTILFTDSNDTLAGTQTLIDFNLVGRIQIIGFGSDPEIISFIKKGIISSSIVTSPELVGYRAVLSLAELCGAGYTSNSVDTGIDVLTQENAEGYKGALGKALK